MPYIAVKWLHSFSDEPVLLLFELDEQRWEVRKIEIFRDGTAGFADATRETATTALGQLPVPPLAEIASDPEFEPREITQTVFEVWWQAVVVEEGTLPDERTLFEDR
jgi:hypothetical protein